MSLSKISLRQVNKHMLLIRYASSLVKSPPNAKIMEEARGGYMAYARNVSRDKKYDQNAVTQRGDTPLTFMFRRLSHAYEVYPLVFLMGAWFTLFCYATYVSFNKIEIWLDRSQETAPWDWSRIRESYWKKPTVVFDISNKTHQRLELMELLQDEMLEAAKKRGTR